MNQSVFCLFLCDKTCPLGYSILRQTLFKGGTPRYITAEKGGIWLSNSLSNTSSRCTRTVMDKFSRYLHSLVLGFEPLDSTNSKRTIAK
mmetsp:Transcript_45324/g.94968  ORF Transcript_45324/g.94968 Transcript_45324/m.94968 type:complete len:89 (+) Transcript_45324:74-340(+)